MKQASDKIFKQIYNNTIASILICYLKKINFKNRFRLCLAEGDIGGGFEEKEVRNAQKPQNQKKWVREEAVLLVAEYFRTRDMLPVERKESIELISRILRKRAILKGEVISETFRNINGITMQFACIKGLDPIEISNGKTGLSGASKLQKEIVKEYLENPEKIKKEAAEVFEKYL